MRKLILLMGLIILSNFPSICEAKNEHFIQVNRVSLNLPSKDNIKIETTSDDTLKFITLESVGLTRKDVDLIATTVYTEANAESDLGQELVAITILNRLNYNGYGDTIKELITPSQFNGVTNPDFGTYTEQNYTNVMRAIYRYYSGELDEKFYAILYFHNPSELDSQAYMERYGLMIIIDEGGHRFMGKKGE